MSNTPTFDQTREALAIAVGMKLQRATIAAILRERHAEMASRCNSSRRSPATDLALRALVAELALLVRRVESLPCDPPPM